MAESETQPIESWQEPPPPPEERAKAEAAWRAMPTKQRRAMQLLKARSWAKGQRGAALSIPEAAAELHCSPATARRRWQELREEGAVTIIPRRLPGYGKVANVYIPRVEYPGSGPPGPQQKEAGAATPAPPVAEIPKRRVKTSRHDSTTNVKPVASSSYQNKRKSGPLASADMAVPEEANEDQEEP
jgi:DNA-binding Lrp family transcriptional regulator